MRMSIYHVQAQQFFLRFYILHSLDNYIRSVYYNACVMNLNFQLQFIKLHCTVNAESTKKCLLKKERSSANQQRDWNLQKIKYHENPEKKRQAVKRRYHDQKESVKQYIKEKKCGKSNIKYCI